MRELLNAYYENTVIPAIICGSLTSLSLCAARYIGGGFLYLTLWEATFFILLFLAIMTVVGGISIFREMTKALDELEGGTRWD